MCVAIPGKLISIEGQHGIIDFNGNEIMVHIGLIDAKIGDYLLVHAGYAVQKLNQSEAEELKNLFAELEDVLHD